MTVEEICDLMREGCGWRIPTIPATNGVSGNNEQIIWPDANSERFKQRMILKFKLEIDVITILREPDMGEVIAVIH